MLGEYLTRFVSRRRPATILFLWAIFTLAGTVARAQELTVSARFGSGQLIGPKDHIELKLNRPLAASEGKLAVFIGRTDITALLETQPDAVGYTPRLPLPAGESEVTVYLVSADQRWNEVARLQLRVADLTTDATGGSPAATTKEADPATQAAPAYPTPKTDPQAASQKRRWGFDKIQFTPAGSINLKSQAAEGHFPASSRPERPTFTDLGMQASFGSEMTRGAFSLQSKFDIVGSSFQKEALRFGQLGIKAPQIDLASYLFQSKLPTSLGGAVVSLGQVSFGSQRHLINSFSSRGLTASIPLGARIDFSAAVMNGTSIVGWDNYFGLDRRKHQVVSGVLGIEFDRERRGAARIELGVLQGSLLPLNNVRQRAITDAERSVGGSVRLLLSDKTQRIKLDAGLARSRFTNPLDPLLNQGANVVTTRPETRNAGYADLSAVLLRDYPLIAEKNVNLTFNLRHEQVDPLFRSIGAFTQADRYQDQFELTGSLGEFNLTAGYLRFHDNLDNIASVLKTLTRRGNLVLNGPLRALFQSKKNDAPPSPWWPRVSYTFDEVHQFGEGIPVRAEFRPDLVPDQISLNQNFTSEWQFAKWRAAYRFNRTSQDNRQPGRALADFLNLVNGATIGYTPHAGFNLDFDVNTEQAKNFETRRLDRTLRFGVITNWRMTSHAALSLNLSTLGAGDLARLSHNRTIEGDAQWSYRFSYEQTRWRKFQGQFFIRYANRYARSSDSLFQLNNLVKTWNTSLGLSLTY